jgi:sterol desaturase/sphingolipid hydroxylase (fatty acid hydroxylase superfamily)
MLAAIYNLRAAVALSVTCLLSLLLIGCGLMLEWVRPVSGLSSQAAIFNVVYLIASIFIQGAISPLVLAGTAIVVSTLGGGIPHMNLRVGFGRFVLLNSPQYHRIHHSSQPSHRDKNFAALFPIFDVMGGTHYLPAADEYPATGLDDGDCPASLTEAIAWPARDMLRGSLRQPLSPAG